MTEAPYMDPLQPPQNPEGGPAEQQSQAPAPMPRETMNSLLFGGDSGQRNEPQERGGFRVGVNPVGFAWRTTNDDWNPAGMRPNESRSTQVGKYGGAPLYAATFAMPGNVIANRLQALKEEGDELNAAFAKINADVEDVDAPEYRDAFTNAVWQDLEGYKDNVIRMHGRNRGMRLLTDPNSKEHREYLRRGSDWTTVSRHINQATKNADAIIAGRNTGVLEVPDFLYKQAEDVRRKTGEYAGQHDVKALAKSLPLLNANVSLVDQFKQDGVMALLKDAQTTTKLFEQVKRGDPSDPDAPGNRLYDPRFARMLATEQKVTGADFIKALAQQYAQQYASSFGGREEAEQHIEKILTSMAPKGYEESVISQQISKKGSGSGGGGGGDKGGRWIPASATVSADTTTAFSDPLTKGDPLKGRNFPAVILADVVSGRGNVPQPRVFQHEGEDVTLVPLRIVDMDGQRWVIGKGSYLRGERSNEQGQGNKDPLQEILNGLEDNQAAGETPTEEQWQQFTKLPEIAVPYDEYNAPMIEAAFGLSEAEADRLLKEARAKQQKSPSAKTTSRSTIKKLVGKPGYEGYTEQELIDYYKSQGYTIE